MHIIMFFDLACMLTCCWGLPKHEPFITLNKGTLKDKSVFVWICIMRSSSILHLFSSSCVVLSAVLPDRSVPETLLSRSPTASFSAPVILSLLQVCADSSEHPDKKSWVTTSYHQPKRKVILKNMSFKMITPLFCLENHALKNCKTRN